MKLKFRFLAVITAALVALLMMFNILGASASQLMMNSSVNLTSGHATRCASILSATSTQANMISIKDIPASCTGAGLTLKTFDSKSVLLASSNGTIRTSSLSLNVTNTASTQKVVVMIDGWKIPTTWVRATKDPITPSPSAPSITVTPTWNQMAATQFCVNINVSTTSKTAVAWKLDLDTAQAPFNGDVNMQHYTLTSGAAFVPGTPVNGIIQVQGANGSKISATAPAVFTLCNYETPPPTISQAPGVIFTVKETVPTRGWYVCKTVTVSVEGTSFYTGWETTVNIKNLRDNFVGTKGTFRGPHNAFSQTQTGPDTYLIKGVGWGTAGIKPGTPVSFEVCYG